MLRILLNSSQLLSIECIAPGQLPSDRFIKDSMLPKDDLQRVRRAPARPFFRRSSFFLPFVEQRSRTLPDALFVHIRPRAEHVGTSSRLLRAERWRDREIFSMTEHRTAILLLFFRKPVLGYQSYKPRDFGCHPRSLLLLHFSLLALFFLSLFLSPAAISSFARYIDGH